MAKRVRLSQCTPSCEVTCFETPKPSNTSESAVHVSDDELRYKALPQEIFNVKPPCLCECGKISSVTEMSARLPKSTSSANGSGKQGRPYQKHHQYDCCEVFSPPRLTQRARDMGMRGGGPSTLHMKTRSLTRSGTCRIQKQWRNLKG